MIAPEITHISFYSVHIVLIAPFAPVLVFTHDLLLFYRKTTQWFYYFIGEQGATLSGGQKQRLAIARALNRIPQILILDESTSSLDSNAEYHVQQTIKQLKKEGRTVIVIAHRLSTVLLSDNIVLLENGKLTEQGSHEKLYSKKKKYYELWQKQILHEILEIKTDWINNY